MKKDKTVNGIAKALASPVFRQRVKPSKAEIEAKRTTAGGWTKAQLAEWGVPWPPPRGWKKILQEDSE